MSKKKETKAPIIVVTAGGKGTYTGSSAEWYRVNLFTSLEEAEVYIKKTEDLASKYWTRASIVTEGYNFEVAYDNFYI